MNSATIKKILTHILLWTIFFGIIAYGFTINLDSTFVNTTGETRSMDFNLLPFRLELYGIIFKVLYFYTCVTYIFPKFFKKKSILLFFPVLLITVLVSYVLETLLLKEIIIGQMFSTNAFTEKAYTYYLVRVNPLMYFILTTLAFIYYFVNRRAQDEKINHNIKQEQLKTELTLLRYQINPHFLFNTLNNFYSIAQEHNVPDLENGILKLSKMMRYILYESNSDMMPLSKEIEYLENYISIHQYKFIEADKFELKVNIKGNRSQKKIAPLLFIPLVENALKHGVRYNKISFVKIDIHIYDDYLELAITNSIHHNKNSLKDNYGIGLVNIQKRLNLIYTDRYKFETTQTENIFTTYLKVPIHAN